MFAVCDVVCCERGVCETLSSEIGECVDVGCVRDDAADEDEVGEGGEVDRGEV